MIKERRLKAMRKKKDNENSPLEKIVLITAIINLINSIVDLIKDLLN
jgi:hypothetical protein